MRIRIYWGLLTLFWLLAVYSTSIWKSFDQRSNVWVSQNIESVLAFNTFIDDTLLNPTKAIIEKNLKLPQYTALPEPQIEVNEEGEGEAVALQGEEMSEGAEEEISETALIQLQTLEQEDQPAQLVEKGRKTIKRYNNHTLFLNQIRSLIIAIIFSIIVFFIPISAFQNSKFANFSFVMILILQLMVFIPALQMKSGISSGWLDFKIRWIPTIQPAEFFKLGYVLFMAHWLIRKKSLIDNKDFLIKFWAVNALVFLIFLFIPDFWTLFILVTTVTLMARYAGLKIKKICILWALGLITAVVGASVMGMVNKNYVYAFNRIISFVDRNPEKMESKKLKDLWQERQAVIAIGGGGFRGQGYGKGLQKMGYLPESYSDFIFAAFSEEIGFIWNCVLFALYLGLSSYFLKRLWSVKDPATRILGVGIISLIMIQAFVHIGVNLRVLPNTWLTLPFISHGGTALMINLIELTLLYKIIKNK